ncbi:tetratricopeptide repeat protein [Amycolatopsis sp. NPDC051716]|uniref:tetratricopeptide repeat protein n=1 Tax=Amycolatopsis sp. NPDC051716 TaxID=3155804 RepID=UPI003415F9C5
MDEFANRPEVVNKAGEVHGLSLQAGTIHGNVQLTVGDQALPRPTQLPAANGCFTGRVSELAELDRSLLQERCDAPPIVLLTGMAGVGKTALAVKWAHGAAEAFPDGQLYADLRGFGPDSPLEPAEVLAGFLRALRRHRPEEFPTAAERAALFRSLLSTRKVLFVLDNVRSADQVRLLLPGVPTCSVVIVSRRQLPGLAVHHAVEWIKVNRLDDTDAVELLQAAIGDRVRSDPASARLLAEGCAGLPLALRIVAVRAAARPSRSLAQLASQLADERARLKRLDVGDDAGTAVRTAFSWTYQRLSDGEARAFRVVGDHPGRHFDVYAMAVLTDTPLGRAEDLLDGLMAMHLLDEPEPNRYEMHDLLRLHAVELREREDDPAEREAVLLRLYDHYLHTADRANRVLMPHRLRVPCPGTAPHELTFGDRASALSWLDAELANLVAMCRLTGPAFDVRCWQLAYTMRDYFFLTKRIDSWVETHTLAWRACQRIGDRRAEARTRNNLGRALLESGDVEAAADHYEHARILFEELGDGHGLSNALANLASILRRTGDFESALANLTRALAFYRKGAQRNCGITLRSMARVEIELARFPDAVRDAEEALAIADELGLDLDAAQASACLGQAHLRSGNLRGARDAFERAVRHSELAGSRYEQAGALRWLGEVALRSGDLGEAREHWRAALRLYEQLGVPVAQRVADELAVLGEL